MDILQLSTKSIAQVNININLVIRRRVNANASPDVPKPLYQREGGCASFPLIQSFGCTVKAEGIQELIQNDRYNKSYDEDPATKQRKD
jgi:hypothetical protein